MIEEKSLHTAEETKKGIKPTLIGIEEVAKAYERYRGREEIRH